MVLGGSDDGGYYLIGVKRLHQRLFEQIDWSTERVFPRRWSGPGKSASKPNCCPPGTTWTIAATLERLRRELLRRARAQDTTPRTPGDILRACRPRKD